MGSKPKVAYHESDRFAVPLRTGGYAQGVIARMNGRGGLFGYFFAPRFNSISELPGKPLRAFDAVLTGRFGDLGLIKGDWKIVGNVENWTRVEWPLPKFFRMDSEGGQAWLSSYDEETLNFIREEKVDPAEEFKYPYDRDMGYGAVEIRLTKLLEKTN